MRTITPGPKKFLSLLRQGTDVSVRTTVDKTKTKIFVEDGVDTGEGVEVHKNGDRSSSSRGWKGFDFSTRGVSDGVQ